MLPLAPDRIERLLELYKQSGLPLDRLPYTSEFENLFTTFAAENPSTFTRSDLWYALTYLRKRSLLPRKGRGK